MLVALMYNPQGSGNTIETIKVHGAVLDENGKPIVNAFVQANGDGAQTLADGSYAFTFNYSYEPPSEFSQNNNIVSAGAEGHWTQMAPLVVSSVLSYEINFTLPRNENITVPLGVLVYPNIVNGSTMVNISVALTVGSLFASIDGEQVSSSIGPWFDPNNRPDTDRQNIPFVMQSTNGTPIQLCMNASVTGTYVGDRHIDSLGLIQAGPIFARPMEKDSLDFISVQSNCTIFHLSSGESKSIGAIEPYDGYNGKLYSLPNIPSLSFDIAFMGKKATVQETRICNTSPGLQSLIPQLVTVTIEPSTGGDHTYAVCIEDGCAIHVWDIGTG